MNEFEKVSFQVCARRLKEIVTDSGIWEMSSVERIEYLGKVFGASQILVEQMDRLGMLEED